MPWSCCIRGTIRICTQLSKLQTIGPVLFSLPRITYNRTGLSGQLNETLPAKYLPCRILARGHLGKMSLDFFATAYLKVHSKYMPLYSWWQGGKGRSEKSSRNWLNWILRWVLAIGKKTKPGVMCVLYRNHGGQKATVLITFINNTIACAPLFKIVLQSVMARRSCPM